MDEREPLLASQNAAYSSIESSSERDDAERSRDRSPSPSSERLRGGNFVYVVFLFLGLGTLLPWNFFITAETYWQYKFRNTTEGEFDWRKRETFLQRLYDPLQVCLSQITNFAFLFINAIFSHLLSERLRLIASLVLMLIFFAVTTVSSVVNTDTWQTGFFVFTMLIIVVMNASGATFQGGLYGLSSKFPQRFINAVGIGQAIGGVFASAARIISLYFGFDDVTSAFIYFLTAAIVMGATLVEYLLVSRTAFFKHYAPPPPALRPPPAEDKPEGGGSLKVLLKEHFRTFAQVWPSGISVCFIFFVTLSVFPVVCVKILSASKNDEWANKYFQPVSTFLLFNLGDYLGRTAAELILWPRKGSRLLYVFAGLRVFLIPLFLLCKHDPSSSVPTVFNHDAWYILFMALFGLSNGYTCALIMMYAPRLVPANESEKVAYMMATMIGLGLLLGSFSSFGFALMS